MNDIKKNQDLPQNMLLLKAQRVIYANAKKIYRWQLTITIIVVVILNFVKLVQKDFINIDLTPYIAIVSVSITLVDLLFLSGYLSKFKTNGAKVQELFDCRIYNMVWNETNSGDMPENWIIEEAEKNYVHNSKAPLTNWYHIDLDGLKHEEAILRCQETNLEYDRKLRFHFKNDCIIICLIIVVSSFVIATIVNASLQGYLTNFIAPTLPLIVILIKLILDNQKAVKSLEEVRKAARKLRNSSEIPSMNQLRQVQDKLYCSRKDSTLIPENYYQYRRTKLEQSTKSNVAKQL
ncbi:MAG: S-4TM family putative pore-forming effector [Flavobacterium sp.]|uniref:S-4TM family putative pore-forming effector n=1 Tax=Flavobacterium sp. TaxID=239 RepID=UPI0022C9A9B9|nr:S-4TM family putative pore-forming effector [Flavobacterium sp.]MCZ8196949.1 S-4TM family putative pore-forming effector [Flavobacterium sp.]